MEQKIIYLISDKYYEKPKSIKDYDIPELCALEIS